MSKYKKYYVYNNKMKLLGVFKNTDEIKNKLPYHVDQIKTALKYPYMVVSDFFIVNKRLKEKKPFPKTLGIEAQTNYM